MRLEHFALSENKTSWSLCALHKLQRLAQDPINSLSVLPAFLSPSVSFSPFLLSQNTLSFILSLWDEVNRTNREGVCVAESFSFVVLPRS